MKTFQATLYDDTDHVEHWDHPKPLPGQPCAAGTEHLHTFTDRYTLGGLLGISSAQRLCRARLAELLGLETEDIDYLWLGVGRGSLDGFSFTLPERYGSAMITYGPNRLWTYCPKAHPFRSWWFMDCKCAVELPQGPAAAVMLTAADMIRKGAS